MTTKNGKMNREKLINALNEDLSREYQAIISYVNYSQVLKGAAYMNIADELRVHATEELSHALQVANHIDYLEFQSGPHLDLFLIHEDGRAANLPGISGAFWRFRDRMLGIIHRTYVVRARRRNWIHDGGHFYSVYPYGHRR